MSKTLCVVCASVALAWGGIVTLGASEAFVNDTGTAATGIRITFSKAVSIMSYDKSVFPNQEPQGSGSEITFSGGQCARHYEFEVTWSPYSASVSAYMWLTETASSPGTSAPLPGIVGPVQDLSGIEDMRSIPVGETKRYYFAAMREEGMTAEQVLTSLSYLAILTFGADVFSATEGDPGAGAEVNLLGGQFGRIAVDPIFAYDPLPNVEYIQVTHHLLEIREGGVSPQDDEDRFTFDDGVATDWNVLLARRYGRPAKGLAEWGLYHAQRNMFEYSEEGTEQIRSLSLWIVLPADITLPLEGSEDKLVTVYNELIFRSSRAYFRDEPDEYSVRMFLEGSDEILRYRPLGPP